MKKLLALTVAGILLAGCNTWSHGELTKDGQPVQIAVSESERTDPAKIAVLEGDITDKKYTVIGDLEVVVNKTTIFNADPTKEMVNTKLKEEASLIGADAVILVRYGTPGVSFVSWGAIEGKGRAIKYAKN